MSIKHLLSSADLASVQHDDDVHVILMHAVLFTLFGYRHSVESLNPYFSFGHISMCVHND